MRNVIKVLAVAAFLLPARTVAGGDTSDTIERFRILLATGQRLEGQQGVLTAEGFTGICGDTSFFVEREHIRRVHQYCGTEALRRSVIGGGIGLAFFVVFGMHCDGDYCATERRDLWTPFASLVGTGAALGLISGLLTPVWKEVKLETAIRFEPRDGETRLVLSVAF
ncbi:MAG: hypothetical protein JSV52_12010 [Candidatus Zixiibacteriota bacterium]|nr:MAG: hypothetical protein JSV52_12010 [candidate division Zixibacteria bacterium]